MRAREGWKVGRQNTVDRRLERSADEAYVDLDELQREAFVVCSIDPRRALGNLD